MKIKFRVLIKDKWYSQNAELMLMSCLQYVSKILIQKKIL